jgi:POT family proton-dependent oligopeptide transporter
MSQASATMTAGGGPTFFGHPRGLSTLFFTEMWERFSYYGMRAILVLYMVQAMTGQNAGMEMDAVTAGAIYGLYTGFVYLVALPGGWIADRITGQRKAVLWGGIVIAAGHFSMAIPSDNTFFLGLILIIIGTGLLKPNISTMVADLYPEGGARRDAGFTIFYMGINIGAFVAPLVCGYLGEQVNWHYGFGAAGVGMVLGITQYVLGGHHLGDAGLYRGTPEERARDLSAFKKVMAAVVLLVAVVGYLMSNGTLTVVHIAESLTYIILGGAALFLGYVGFLAPGIDTQDRKRVGVIAILFLAAALFWSGFEQAGSSMNLFADRLTDRVMFGWEMPASWLQSVNPLLIISLAPVFGWLWVFLARRHLEPSSPVKFSLGLILLGAGFGVMVLASLAAVGQGTDIDNANLVGAQFLVLTYFLHTCGELCLSPVGLSTMTKLAPKSFVGQMMGIWFMASALGNVIAGRVAGGFETLPLYQLFGNVAMITAGAGLFLLVLSPWVKRLIGELN